MAAPSLQERVLQALRACRHDLEGSLVYLDSGTAEAVSAGIGLAALQDGEPAAAAPHRPANVACSCAHVQAVETVQSSVCSELGAALVCDLSAATPTDLPTAQLLSGGPAPVRRVALLLTTLLGEAAAAVLAACESCSAAAQFTVLCAVSEAAHHDESPAAYPPACYAAVAASWQQRLNERRLTAGLGPCSLVVRHLPLLLCPLTSSAFVLPAGSAAARLPRAGRFAAGYSTSAAAAAADSDDDEPHLAAKAASPGARGSGSGSHSGGASGAPTSGLGLLAHALVDAAATLGYRPEAFSLGPCR